MSLFPFVKHFIGVKGGDAAAGVVKAIVQLDPDGATQADLRVMEEDLDRAGRAIAKLRADLVREQKEFDAVNRQYQELMGAAEVLERKVKDTSIAAAQRSDLERSLASLLDKLEHMAPELDAERRDVTDTEALLADAEDAYKNKADALAAARQNLERAKHDLARAKIQEERSAERAEQAAVVAGLKRAPTSRLTVALDVMQKSTEDARQRAEANTMKASALARAQDAAADKNIAQALIESRGTSSNKSVSERLAALAQRGGRPGLLPPPRDGGATE
jgi:DNA repair exonuclease SbcCD ATPase subunit